MICDSCSCENVFPSPKMYDFSSCTLEKGLGWDIYYELEKDEVCDIKSDKRYEQYHKLK